MKTIFNLQDIDLDDNVFQFYLVFSLGQENFGAPAKMITEILEVPTITKVPRSSPEMRGVINLRGSVVPIVDIRNKLGLNYAEDTEDTRIIIMEILMDDHYEKVGAVVDDMQEVLDIRPEQIKEIGSSNRKYEAAFTNEIAEVQDQTIYLLQPDHVFAP
ncbi:chemotaxis protein CheW [Fulvivirga ligni]|uniref:chemotaxis protein CheW n=1 Tax=Fulvivirga ligni TaxID=2904246 RepID=UPI001F30D2FB|nr:chemotaxis protein CheW [Fulvivirga ligni]UII20769.1 chemotaxis protein CheW [Fulvivirga ligni]